MFNIILGIAFIIGGLSGKLALRGTGSGAALAVIGLVLVLWGAWQVKRQKAEAAAAPQAQPQETQPK